ncbi:MAG: hypothetical protein CMI66_11360 [Pedosphaera sp.]|nr:hypothetical protein [Pedosphaera sp.]
MLRMHAMTPSNISKKVQPGRLRPCFFSHLIFGTFIWVCSHSSLSADAFQKDWTSHIDRTWIGPEFWANRLQDWEIKNGFIQCIESSKKAPLRTLNLITGSTILKGDSLKLAVEIHSEKPSKASQALAGFLIGSGGSHVDYRLSALTHHRPAEDGGMLAVVNMEGRVFLFDHSKPIGKDNLWSISGSIATSDLPMIAQGNRPDVDTDVAVWNKLTLTLNIQKTEHGLRTDLESRNSGTGSLISRLTLWSTPEAFTDGGVALVSHLSPDSSDKGFGFNRWSIEGDRFDHDYDRHFGPILTTQYTLSRSVLSLTAQAGPLSAEDTQRAALEIYDGNQSQWRPIAYSELQPMSYTFPFRIEDWDDTRDTPYRIVYDLKTSTTGSERTFFEGTIRKNPTEKEEFVISAFTGHKIFTGGLKWNHHGVWFPHNDILDAVQHHDPDFLFFSGDQIYEGDMTPAVYEPLNKAMLDYLYKWYRWCWAFKDLTRNRPTVTIPDDHDVYHGNIWGAGGKATSATGSNNDRQNSGGYRMPASFVNSVHRTQVSHLPPRADKASILQGISTYHGRVEYGGVSFAVIADRMFKSSPTLALPEAQFDNGWAQNPTFNPATQGDVTGATLLGKRQLDFLNYWATDWSDQAWMKVVLSQTLFANVATLPGGANSDAIVPSLRYFGPDEYPENDHPVADGDSNGWPQTGRNLALKAMRKGFAFHIAGDQHLGSTIQYGVDQWGDAGYALCVPSVANTWPRRWYPKEPGKNVKPGAPKYTGDFLDGWGNRVSVEAVSNPMISGRKPADLYDRAPGYGIAKFNKSNRKIKIECWPRWEDPSQPDAKQYPGWPIEITQKDNYGRKAVAWLPTLVVEGLISPIVQVWDTLTEECIYALRMEGQVFRPKVFATGTYTVMIGEPGTTNMRTLQGLVADRAQSSLRRIIFERSD